MLIDATLALVTRLLAWPLVLAASCALAVPAARADGDPASDALLSSNVFLPYRPASSGTRTALKEQIASVYTAGNRIKVAVVADKEDLGAIPSLFDKPADYVRFLGQELSMLYVGPLLVVMPAGFGVYDGGRSTAAEDGVLQGIAAPHSTQPDDLVNAATNAVSALERAGALRSKDILPPFVQILSAKIANRKVALTSYLYDDSGTVRLVITLANAGRTVSSTQTRYVPALLSTRDRRTLALPGGMLVSARVCITAYDRGGNHKKGCKAL
jgi:hypothetical protein